MKLRSLLLVLALSSACVLLTGATRRPVPLMRDALIGKWNITLTPDEDARHDGEKDFKDTLVFKGGTLETPAWNKKHGFEAGPYDEDTRPGGVGGFTAVQISKTDQSKAKWSGFVTATEMRGDLKWTKKDGTVENYSFTGGKE